MTEVDTPTPRQLIQELRDGGREFQKDPTNPVSVYCRNSIAHWIVRLRDMPSDVPMIGEADRVFCSIAVDYTIMRLEYIGGLRNG